MCKWAPSSEFVSSSIPSWQTLTAHAKPFRGTRDLAFCLKVPLDSLLVWASSGGSGETARMSTAMVVLSEYTRNIYLPSFSVFRTTTVAQIAAMMRTRTNITTISTIHRALPAVFSFMFRNLFTEEVLEAERVSWLCCPVSSWNYTIIYHPIYCKLIRLRVCVGGGGVNTKLL